MSGQKKQEVLKVVEQTQRWSEWPLEPILACLGVPRCVYFSWRARAEAEPLAETPRAPTSYDRGLPDEVEATKEFALRYPKTEGFPLGTWERNTVNRTGESAGTC